MNIKSRFLVGGVCAAMTFGVTAPVSAQTTQDGLVNVALDGVTVQVPIAIAANICNVPISVLATAADVGDVDCNADADSEAVVVDRGDGGPVTQNGLVNLALTDVTVQVPVSVAANVCEVPVSVLARQLRLGDTSCDATGNADARG